MKSVLKPRPLPSGHAGILYETTCWHSLAMSSAIHTRDEFHHKSLCPAEGTALSIILSLPHSYSTLPLTSIF